jgi:hypothetical protein
LDWVELDRGSSRIAPSRLAMVNDCVQLLSAISPSIRPQLAYYWSFASQFVASYLSFHSKLFKFTSELFGRNWQEYTFSIQSGGSCFMYHSWSTSTGLERAPVRSLVASPNPRQPCCLHRRRLFIIDCTDSRHSDAFALTLFWS